MEFLDILEKKAHLVIRDTLDHPDSLDP